MIPGQDVKMRRENFPILSKIIYQLLVKMDSHTEININVLSVMKTNYQTWEIIINVIQSVTPPKEYNLDDKIRFLLANGGKIRNIGPDMHTARCYCTAVID